MSNNINRKLNGLENQIQNDDILTIAKDVDNWGGADVIIDKEMTDELKEWVGNQPFVISLQKSEPRRRAVITKHAKELSWLFYELKEIFSERIDFSSKYDFYGFLDQSGIDYISEKQPDQNLHDLLLAVLATAKTFV